jgi:hypothetical protein
VIGFGSGYVKLFPSSRVYDDETLEQANQHVAAIRADLGGTQLLEPLRDVLSSPSDPKYPRQVFVLVRTFPHDQEKMMVMMRTLSDFTDESYVGSRLTARWTTRTR